jgi:hypothetical protein
VSKTDYNVEFFRDELKLFKSIGIATVVEYMLTIAPKYFWTVPASSTGKYHPEISLGDGGLCRHVKAALLVLKETLQNESIMNVFFERKITEMELDGIRGAIILHDLCKQGLDDKGTHSVTEHPLLVRELTKRIPEELKSSLTSDEKKVLNIMILAIESHMGQWNTDYKSKKEVLPKPKDNLQCFVHYCDYIASRKFMTLNT